MERISLTHPPPVWQVSGGGCARPTLPCWQWLNGGPIFNVFGLTTGLNTPYVDIRAATTFAL